MEGNAGVKANVPTRQTFLPVTPNRRAGSCLAARPPTRISRPVQRIGRIVSHALVGGLHHQYARI